MAKEIKIGVISDTHFRSLAEGAQFVEHLLSHQFADVDVILHAGDLVHPDLPLLFVERPFYCVKGNMDSVELDAPDQQIIEFNGFRVGLIHGWGDGAELERRLLEYCHTIDLDCLVYGHSHKPSCHKVGSLFVMNPGSATDRRSAPWHSVGILYIGEEIRGEIINIDVE